jgi:hypothetical protein
MEDWPQERWLDVRDQRVWEIMARRLALAQVKGCDGVEPDNLGAYQGDRSGFPITREHQLAYDRYLSDQAHARGMLIALKNSTELVPDLVDAFDFSIVESCYRFSECHHYDAFAEAGKAVLMAEYQPYNENWCADARANGYSLAYANSILDGRHFEPCRADLQ